MSTPSEKINFIPFKAIKEPWNEYKLEDGSILRVRVILAGVIKESDTAFSMQSSTVFNVIPNPKYIGITTPPLKPNEKLDSYVEAEDLKILEKKELWNEYELPSENMRLNIKGVLVSVSRTSRCDEKGIPIYLTNVQLLIKHKKERK